jgi:hypothetical protein
MTLCPGCGRPHCPCTPADIRHQLEQDRAELSRRAAEWAPRMNEAVRLLRLAKVGTDPTSPLVRDIIAWLKEFDDE